MAATGRERILLAIGLLFLLLSGVVATTADAKGTMGRAGSAVVDQVHSRSNLRAYWSPKRIRQATPLSTLTYSRPGGRLLTAGGGASPAAADPSAQGTDTGDSTQYPNSANGIVLFDYGPDGFQCSGSVVNSPAGNVVLTAGHCVIDPGPGTPATNIVFIPGYRDGAEPFGEWPATSFATTPEWQTTAGTGNPNDADEAGDMAMLGLANRLSDSATVQSVVGAVGISFNQSRSQTYMQYGYPVETPYDGSRLYENTSTLKFNDSSFSPATMGIASDFTPGSSGGPWLVGNSPAAMSVTDYTYNSLPGFMFGPYFGSIAQSLFVTVGGSPAGSSATGTIHSPSPASTPAAAPPSNAFTVKVLSRNRRRGVLVLGVSVPGPGTVKLSGDGLRPLSRTSAAKGTVRLRVHSKGSTLAELRKAGRVLVQAQISFKPSGGSLNRKGRELVLIEH